MIFLSENPREQFNKIRYLLQWSISPTFYEQLLHAQRSQKRKKQHNLTVFLALLGSAGVKYARKMLVKLTPGARPIKFLLSLITFPFYATVSDA